MSAAEIITIVIITIVILSGVLGWGYFALSWKNFLTEGVLLKRYRGYYLPTLGHPNQQFSAAIGELAILLASFFAFLVLGTALYSLGGGELPEGDGPIFPDLIFIEGLAKFGAVVTAFIFSFFAIHRYETVSRLFQWFKLDSQRVTYYVRRLLFAWFATCAILLPVGLLQEFLSRLVPYTHEVLNQLDVFHGPVPLIYIFLAVVILGPIAEEYLFRRVLINCMVLGFSGYSANPKNEPAFIHYFGAVLVSSFLFSAMHIGQGLAPIPLFFFAVALGMIYLYEGSLVSCVLIHMFFNGLNLGLILLSK
ncbi:MAG: CPBP family intramembrane metalloprotease [Pirellulaceae bacterium]|nr:CPBP family intramembrane metalloprotease [Pirellulaceae bacterium]